MLPDVFVPLNPLQQEESLVIIREPANHFIEGSRNQDLVSSGKAHDALPDVDSVAECVQLAVQVGYQLHGPEIHADAGGEFRLLLTLFVSKGVPKPECRKHGWFRRTEEADRCPIAGIENYAIIF